MLPASSLTEIISNLASLDLETNTTAAVLGIRGHDVSGPHGVSSSFEFRAYLSARGRPLYDGKKF
jgi:hypothetical protein